jgi:hypothetical protein
VGPMTAGPFQISLRRVHADHMRPGLGQTFRQDTGPAGHIEHASTRSDIGEGEEGLREVFAPAPHERVIRVRIGPPWFRGFHGAD